MYEGEWFLAEKVKDQSEVCDGYTRLNYAAIRGQNHFAWPDDLDIVTTLNEDIILDKVTVEVMNSRGYFGLIRSDLKKVQQLLVFVHNIPLFSVVVSVPVPVAVLVPVPPIFKKFKSKLLVGTGTGTGTGNGTVPVLVPVLDSNAKNFKLKFLFKLQLWTKTIFLGEKQVKIPKKCKKLLIKDNGTFYV